jgi:DNA-binding winged helix-turn-helix (wHTH) protein/tetratricopeptide (TPR) repeat protein
MIGVRRRPARRIDGAVRRPRPTLRMPPITYLFDDFRLDRSARELRRGGAPVTVPTRVFDCLVYLIDNRDRAVGRDELVAALWGRVDVSDAQLGQIVLRARRAIGDDGNDQRYIRTMPKFGYRWLVDVRTVESMHADAEVRAPESTRSTVEAPPPIEGSESASAVGTAPEPAPPLSASSPRPQPRRASALWLALVVALLAVLAVMAWMRAQHEPPATPANAPTTLGALVRPLEVTATPPQDWLRLGGMDALAARLRAGGLRVPPSEAVLALLHAGGEGVDAEARLRQASATELLIDGRLVVTAQGWHVVLLAKPVDGETIRVEADARDALTALRGAADRLLSRLGHVPPDDSGPEGALDETLQRANAAMLANQLEVARSILLKAPDLVQAEPQLRYRLAQVDFRAGDLDAVEKVLGSLLEDKPGPKDPALRAGALTGLGTVHLNRGDFARAERDFSAAIVEVEDWHRPLELGQAYGGRGAARAAQGHYADALQDLARARVELQQAGDGPGQARLDMVEGELELQRGRVDAARPVLERAVAVFERFDAVNERLHSLSMLLACSEHTLDHASALALSDKAWALRARVRDPQLRGQMLVDRAEVLHALGRLLETAALLEEATREPAPRNPEYTLRIARVRTRLALDAGHWEEASRLAEGALAGADVPELASLRAWFRAAATEARIALDSAVDQAHRTDRTDRIDGGDGGGTWGAFARALIDAHSGRVDAADADFRLATERADAAGTADDLVTVVVAHGRWQLAHGREADAQATIGRVAAWADRDFRCALLQLELFHRLGASAAWYQALVQAERLAGERTIPPALRQPPRG